MQPKRLLWMDYIKIFGTFLIVMQHSISGSFTSLPVEGIEWKIISFIFMISRMGVPIFIMCSGAGMLSRERSIKDIWRKNIFSLVIVYVSWMLIYGIKEAVTIALTDDYSIRVIINAVLKCILFGKYHTWFIIMLIGMYMITPLLYAIIQKEENLKYFVVLSVLFTTLLPMVSYFECMDRLYAVIENFNMHLVVGYSMYFVIGFYITRYRNKILDKYVELILLLTVIVTYAFSCFLSVKAGSAIQEPYQLFSPLALVISVSLFLLFQKHFNQEENDSKAGNKIAGLERYGIVIYLVHVLFIEAWAKGSGLIYIFCGILIWLLSLVIGIVIDRIPILNNFLIINRRDSKTADGKKGK